MCNTNFITLYHVFWNLLKNAKLHEIKVLWFNLQIVCLNIIIFINKNVSQKQIKHITKQT